MRTRVAAAVLVSWVVVALAADLLASDLPIAVRLDGHVYVLPALTRPRALLNASHQSLRGRAEWLVPALVPFGPLQTFATTQVSQAGAPPWGPSAAHWLGTDDLGRDVLARVVHGARVSLVVALAVAVFAALLGAALGGLAGWKGGAVDLVFNRLLEVTVTFPTTFFLIAVIAALRGPSLSAVALVLVLTQWPETARLMRAEVLRLKGRDFVLASRALGASEARLLRTHVLPNVIGTVLISATSLVGSAVLYESALSFMGLTVRSPAPSWGELFQQAHRSLVTPGAWWLAVFPGLAVVSLVLSTQALGRALERRFDAQR